MRRGFVVANSKAVLGTESGSSFVDFTGEVQGRVEAFERDHPEAPFDVVRDQFLEGRDGEIVIHVISPRCFEAAALRTLMVLYPGTYSGALEAGRHYVPLARDHSNMAEVVAIIRDPDRAGPIINRAYREVACAPQWTFRSFIAGFDDVVDQEHTRVGLAPVASEACAYLTQLHTQSMQRARVRAFRMRLATNVMKVASGAERNLEKALPAPVVKPLLGAGRVIGAGVKPLVRRLLVGK